MLLPIEIALTIGVAYMVAWRTQPLARKTMAVLGLSLTGLGFLMSTFGIVGVEPYSDGKYTAVDILIPIIAGIIIGLFVRLVDWKFPEIKAGAPLTGGRATASGATNVFNASAPNVIGMSTEPPPARGGLI